MKSKIMKSISIFLSIMVFIVSTGMTTFAYTKGNKNNQDSMQDSSKFVNDNGELQLINSITTDKGTTVEVQGLTGSVSTITSNAITEDGTTVAQYTQSKVEEQNMKPMETFQWYYSDTPGNGNSTSYTVYQGMYKGNIKLSNVILQMTVTALSSVILYACKVPAIASIVAGTIISGCTATTNSNCIYYTESTYTPTVMSSWYKQCIDLWYYDSAYKNHITTNIYYGTLM